MEDEKTAADCRKDAQAVLGIQIQTHERYHTQKENMTWLVAVAYLGATMLLVGREPFWKHWPVEWFEAWLILLLVTAATVLMFLIAQFRARHAASAFFLAANNVATRWLTEPPTQADLQPKAIRELDGMLVFAAVERHFGEVVHDNSSLTQRVALFLIAAWSAASTVYLLSTYISCRLPYSP